MRLPYQSGTVRVTSPFGQRQLNGSMTNHKGLDLVGSEKTIVAAVDGVVGYSGMIPKSSGNRTWEWGNYVRIDGDDGKRYYCCHMSKRVVSTGQRVKEGDPIGIEGNTGYSFGSHCHFEIRNSAGVSLNPAELLGIENKAGKTYPIDNASVQNKQEPKPDTYTKNGLKFVRAKDFRIQYYDKKKKDAPYDRYINAGFFASYRDAKLRYFTLPVANLVCDCKEDDVPLPAKKYIDPHLEKTGKLRYDIEDNTTKQFKGKKVATLVVPITGKPYIEDLDSIPQNAKYAISGVPTVRHGDDVDYYNYVKKQGWDLSCMRPTYRHWLGVRDGEIWIITGKTSTLNYIYGMEFWKKVKDEGFDDIICLDGGGSYIFKNGGETGGTAENRQVNTLITF